MSRGGAVESHTRLTVSSRFTAATGELVPSGVLVPVLRAAPE